jgi:hypothetical protein
MEDWDEPWAEDDYDDGRCPECGAGSDEECDPDCMFSEDDFYDGEG